MSEQAAIGKALVDACASYMSSRSWDPYDVREGLHDLWRLSAREDCCYDRVSIGLSYALWYHARRTQDALRALSPSIEEHDGDLDLLDLGCGTGATLWAIAVARRNGHLPGRVRVHAVDGSPPMLDAAKSLWWSLRAHADLGAACAGIDVTFSCQSWTQPLAELDEPWIVGAYLFDDSDEQRVDEVAEALQRVAIHNRVSRIHLLGSSGKRRILEAACARFGDWTPATPALAAVQWRGEVVGLHALRQQLYRDVDANVPWEARRPTFDGDSVVGARLLAPFDVGGQLPLGPLSVMPLDDAQVRAAQPARPPQLGVIVGAAGSGKSRVLVERLALTIEDRIARREPIAALVTTFNTQMVSQLGSWLEERLERSPTVHLRRRRPGEGRELFTDPDDARRSVTLLNWDKVPTRLFGVDPISGGTGFRVKLEKRIDKVPDELQPGLHGRVVDPSFLEAELQRIIWGLRVADLDGYLKAKRDGRGSQLGQQQRRTLWWILMGRDHPELFPHVRMRANALADVGEVPVFDAVFLDECQDFTPADFGLLSQLVTDARHIVAFGDETQAMQLGPSYRRPGTLAGRDGRSRRWTQLALEGSYRLPLRICEAVQPLAAHLDAQHLHHDADGEPVLTDFVLPQAMKSSVLGIRPIVVTGTHAEVRQQIAEIIDCYGALFEQLPPAARRITIAESDRWLQAQLAQCVEGYAVEATTMRRIKGLERPLVLWSTRAILDVDEAKGEWVYTILTRTTTLLVIVLSVSTQPEIAELVGVLRRDRLLFWTEAAEKAFDRLVAASAW